MACLIENNPKQIITNHKEKSKTFLIRIYKK